MTGAICRPTADGTCEAHGGRFGADPRGSQYLMCATDVVLSDVRDERARQFARYGTNDSLEDGTGPNSPIWNPVGMGPAEAEKHFRRAYESHEDYAGAPTWAHLVLEEVAESFVETDIVKLRAELIQVAALAVSWVETLDGREKSDG